MADLINPHEIINNDDGTKTIITFKIDNGKKIKITQKIKEIKVTEKVHPLIAERRNWIKYGKDKGSSIGPNHSTTQLGENINLNLIRNWKQVQEEKLAKKRNDNNNSNKNSSINCRICGNDHLTMHCPFKSIMNDIAMLENNPDSSTLNNMDSSKKDLDSNITDSNNSSNDPNSSKYVPPSKRAGAKDPSSDAFRDSREREESRTLKITQLNENADEMTLKNELLFPFQPIERVVVVRNKDTGRSRGLAFVTFSSDEIADRALQLLNGRGFMNLILNVERSKPRN